MAYFTDIPNKQYYQGSDFGNYQFTSLDDVINQFLVAYVGEDKIIPKVKRTDVQFHAMRALQEFSFDVFKSIKSQQIDVPQTLTMILPHDYINYTKLSFTDTSGIKHPLYQTNDTSNPFQILQDDDGQYSFPTNAQLIVNNDFSTSPLNIPWALGCPTNGTNNLTASTGGIAIDDGKLKFSHRTYQGDAANNWSKAQAVWQPIDVTGITYLDLTADATAVNMTNGVGTIRFGLSTTQGDSTNLAAYETHVDGATTYTQSPNATIDIFDIQGPDGNAYVEWTAEDTGVKTIDKIDVRDHNVVYVMVTSFMTFTGGSATVTTTNFIDDLGVFSSIENLSSPAGNELESSTWQNYKSNTPSENNNDDYEDDIYWPMSGNRYGLDPRNAQANGSFYIDNRLGKIHFSSNMSGKTVILDYISDSLGTDAEMQVHKFAEEAMYKWIMHAIISTRANVPEYQVNRLKKERRAAMRQAKLRLSNIKLEDITQILRGKSKQIKH